MEQAKTFAFPKFLIHIISFYRGSWQKQFFVLKGILSIKKRNCINISRD